MPPELHKHTMRLYAGDYDALHDLYPDVPVNSVIRTLIHNHVLEKRAQIPTVEVKV
jgi:hypothetical protein